MNDNLSINEDDIRIDFEDILYEDSSDEDVHPIIF